MFHYDTPNWGRLTNEDRWEKVIELRDILEERGVTDKQMDAFYWGYDECLKVDSRNFKYCKTKQIRDKIFQDKVKSPTPPEPNPQKTGETVKTSELFQSNMMKAISKMNEVNGKIISQQEVMKLFGFEE